MSTMTINGYGFEFTGGSNHHHVSLSARSVKLTRPDGREVYFSYTARVIDVDTIDHLEVELNAGNLTAQEQQFAEHIAYGRVLRAMHVLSEPTTHTPESGYWLNRRPRDFGVNTRMRVWRAMIVRDIQKETVEVYLPELRPEDYWRVYPMDETAPDLVTVVHLNRAAYEYLIRDEFHGDVPVELQ
jgi:hypothetical protein